MIEFINAIPRPAKEDAATIRYASDQSALKQFLKESNLKENEVEITTIDLGLREVSSVHNWYYVTMFRIN